PTLGARKYRDLTHRTVANLGANTSACTGATSQHPPNQARRPSPEAYGDAVPYVRDHVGTLATIHADEGAGWDALHAGWMTRRVNHSVAFMDKGVCTNQAESYFSRLRRAEIGTHHHIAGPYLYAYAGEMSWREDNRRRPNGTQASMVASAAMASPVSRQWAGYWQRAA
ncbi:MAG: transposase, partial [Sandaracinobacter sp.]